MDYLFLLLGLLHLTCGKDLDVENGCARHPVHESPVGILPIRLLQEKGEERRPFGPVYSREHLDRPQPVIGHHSGKAPEG